MLLVKGQHQSQQAKTTSVPLMIGSKIGVSVFTTLIQHSTGSPSHSTQPRRRNKRHVSWKVVKLSLLALLAHDVILYIETFKIAQKNY